MFTDNFELNFNNIESLPGSEAPIMLEKEFKATEILKDLEDLHERFKKLWEIQDRYFERMEKYYDKIESEKAGEDL